MSDSIRKLTIEGFKSIRRLEDFELGPLNVLIGANGSGKSNFVGFLRLLKELVGGRLQRAVQTIEGGVDACLFLGPKVTQSLAALVCFERNAYGLELTPTADNRLVFADEFTVFEGHDGPTQRHIHTFEPETRIDTLISPPDSISEKISGWAVYHFHDRELASL